MSRARLLLPFNVAMLCFFLASSRPGQRAWFAISVAMLALGILRIRRTTNTGP